MTTQTVDLDFAARLEAALAQKRLNQPRHAQENGAGQPATSWNQARLAQECNVSQQAVSKWMAGQIPRDKTLQLIAQLLDVTPEYLRWGIQSTSTTSGNQFYLVHASAEELEILSLHRMSTLEGKRHMKTAGLQSEKLPADAIPALPQLVPTKPA